MCLTGVFRVYYCVSREAKWLLVEENHSMAQTYLTTEELSKLIKYDTRTIREQLKDRVLLEGVHYIRPFGGRKILYVWETIQRDISKSFTRTAIPMANGGFARG